MSSPQTGPSSERHQHSALLAVFFCPASFFACCSIIDTFFAVEIFELFLLFIPLISSACCCILCGKPQFRATCLSLSAPAWVPMRLDPPQTWGARSYKCVLLQFFRKKTNDSFDHMNIDQEPWVPRASRPPSDPGCAILQLRVASIFQEKTYESFDHMNIDQEPLGPPCV